MKTETEIRAALNELNATLRGKGYIVLDTKISILRWILEDPPFDKAKT